MNFFLLYEFFHVFFIHSALPYSLKGKKSAFFTNDYVKKAFFHSCCTKYPSFGQSVIFHIPHGCRGNAINGFKLPIKIAGIRIAYLPRDVIDTHIRT